MALGYGLETVTLAHPQPQSGTRDEGVGGGGGLGSFLDRYIDTGGGGGLRDCILK